MPPAGYGREGLPAPTFDRRRRSLDQFHTPAYQGANQQAFVADAGGEPQYEYVQDADGEIQPTPRAEPVQAQSQPASSVNGAAPPAEFSAPGDDTAPKGGHTDLGTILRSMEPELRDETYFFVNISSLPLPNLGDNKRDPMLKKYAHLCEGAGDPAKQFDLDVDPFTGIPYNQDRRREFIGQQRAKAARAGDTWTPDPLGRAMVDPTTGRPVPNPYPEEGYPESGLPPLATDEMLEEGLHRAEYRLNEEEQAAVAEELEQERLEAERILTTDPRYAKISPALDPIELECQMLKFAMLLRPVSMVMEKEGLSLIVPSYELRSEGEDAYFPLIASRMKSKVEKDAPMRMISLNVHSSLQMCGLTAYLSTIMAQADISCNMVAGFYHDHMFVDAKRAEDAMQILEEARDNAAADDVDRMFGDIEKMAAPPTAEYPPGTRFEE